MLLAAKVNMSMVQAGVPTLKGILVERIGLDQLGERQTGHSEIMYCKRLGVRSQLRPTEDVSCVLLLLPDQSKST